MAATLRGVVAVFQWADNASVRLPSLDAAYYLGWAREIVAGDVLSAGPVGASEPYLLNPLYAWLIAPLVGLFEPAQPAVMALQAALGGATAWLAAAAARRFATCHAARGAGARRGRGAAWTAGLLVAFSAALTHLATHVSVATLAAFLIAGALFAMSPAAEERGHGALPAGVWLGVGALARPVTMLALPFLAAACWLRAEGDRRLALRSVLVLLAAFGAFAGMSLVRNAAVAGEPVVFTAANGLNLHLGQNPLARRTRSMQSDEFRFGPIEMHVDAKHRVARELGREPSRAEISDWYRARALAEVSAHPSAALAFYGRKLLWFFSPAEPPSSADLTQDLQQVWLLRLGFVPTWLLVVAWLALLPLGRRDVALVAGGLIAAHIASCALAFPLSHYRAPAIPALAVAVAVGAVRVRAASVRMRVGVGVLAVIGTTLAWAPTPPAYLRSVLRVNDAVEAIRAGNGPAAEAAAADALAEEPLWYPALTAMTEAQILLDNRSAALAWVDRSVEQRPWVVVGRYVRATLLVDLGRRDEALREVESLVREFPWSAAARGARGELRAFTGDVAGAREDLLWAAQRGYVARPGALARAGLPRRD